MLNIKNLKMDDLTNLIEQKVLEFLGDPDSGLELRGAFKQELRERLKKTKRIPHKQTVKKVG